MPPAAILLLLLAANVYFFGDIVDAMKFTVVDPSPGSRWLSGAILPIKWKLDDVDLPYSDLRVKVELHLNTASGASKLYSTIIADTANDGLYEWKTPAELIQSAFGFRIVVGPTVDSRDEHRRGVSGPFKFQDAVGSRTQLNARASEDQSDDSVFYPGTQKLVSWKSGLPTPQFSYGVHVELHSDAQSDPVQLLGLNVSTNTGMDGVGSMTWSVPSVLQLENDRLQFKGFIMIWGYDSRSQRLVFDKSHSFAIDFTDKIPLTIQIKSPTATSTVYHGLQFTIALAMVREDAAQELGRGLPVNARPTTITLAIYNRDNKHLIDIVADHVIQRSDWTNGNYYLQWNVPDKFPKPKEEKELEYTDTSSMQGQTVFQTAAVESESLDYRIVYSATYELVEPQRDRRAISGGSDFFSVKKSLVRQGSSGTKTLSTHSAWAAAATIFAGQILL